LNKSKIYYCTPIKELMELEELINLLNNSEIYDLEHVRYIGMPAFQPVQPGYLYYLYRHHENYYKPEIEGPRTSSSGLIIMSDQSGTHIDALCHQASDLKLIDKIKITPEVETPWGFTQLGAETIKPIITRGILVDVARYYGDPLPEESEITLEMFKGTLERENIEIKPKDVVLVRTGYGKMWNEPSKYEKAAGVSKEVSIWLSDKEIFAVGIDNLSWDVPKVTDSETKSKLPGHLYLIAKKGIHIIENVNLEEISAKRVYKFLFIGLPLKFKGATGSPLRPLAIVPRT
jgi:kynurenine formamidase